MRRRLTPLLIVSVLAAVIAITVLVGGKPASTGTAEAPALPTQVLVAPRVSIASLRGKPAIIHFWASLCDPCKKEAPQLERLAAELRGRAALVGVAWSDGHANAQAFLRQHGWTFSVLEDDNGAVGNRYGLTGLPTTFLLDTHGRIVRRLVGGQTAAGLLTALKQ